MCCSKKTPVGFFDSGVGGLTVLRAFLEKIGDFPFHYLADTANCPYGDRPLPEVKKFALSATDFLVKKGCKTIVMACNISSSIALAAARKKFPGITVHGLVNSHLAGSVKTVSRAGKIGVLATSGTVKSKKYPEVLHARGLRVYQQSCPPLVPLVEAGELSGQRVEKILQELLAPLLDRKIDTLILGCTHYPFLTATVRRLLPPEIKLVDPGKILAENLAPQLQTGSSRQITGVWSTGESRALYQLLRELPKLTNPTVHPTSTDHSATRLTVS